MSVPVNHAQRAHALLSASSSKQWLTCTPSARLSDQFQDTSSEFAKEGSLAHEIAELKLRKYFIDPMGPRKFNASMKKLQSNALYQQEMEKTTDTYLEYIQAIVHSFTAPPYIAVEKRLDYSTYAPEGFGTGDCIVIGGNTLYINDYKHGKGVPVSAERNTQMMLYALGAIAEYGILYPIQTVKIAIIQPRLDNISEDSITVEELLVWGESIKPIAQKAWKGEGEFVSGDHCRFCRARKGDENHPPCRARSESYTALDDFKLQDGSRMKPPLISNEELGQILEKAEGIAQWVADLKEYALAQCLSGAEVAGWKAVAGRTSRQYVDLDQAFAALTASGIAEAVLYERKPLTVAAVENVLGKKQYRELLEEPGLVKKEPGKPTLALAADKREAISNRMTAAEAFGNS